jgi:glucosamine--fructose-6-phosphate aminotransferase (isomerizing)
MIPTDDPRRPMYDEIWRRPGLIRDGLEELDHLVRTTLPADACRRWTRVLLTGCGDSYYAGLATELAFASWTGLAVDVRPALQGGRYTIPAMAPPGVVFSVSHSGRVSRTIETVALARARGLDSVAVTGTPASPITREARWVLARPLPVSGRTPGVRSYTQAQLFLLLAALYIGECRGVVDPAQARATKAAIRRAAEALQAGLAAADELACAVAARWRDAEQLLIVGGGPSYANALFAAAKLVEACGVNAVGQELEEWAHIQFFLRGPHLPLLLIAPPGRCHDRACELVAVMRQLGGAVAVVGAADDAVLRAQATEYFALAGDVEEALSPLLTSTPAELIACHLARLQNERFFRADGRGAGVGRGRITDSRIARDLAPWTSSPGGRPPRP